MQRSPIASMAEGQYRRQGRGASKANLQTAWRGWQVKKKAIS